MKLRLAAALLLITESGYAHEPDVRLKEIPQTFRGTWVAFDDTNSADPMKVDAQTIGKCNATSIIGVALGSTDTAAKTIKIEKSCPGYKIREWWSWRVINGIETLIVANPSADAINVFAHVREK